VHSPGSSQVNGIQSGQSRNDGLYQKSNNQRGNLKMGSMNIEDMGGMMFGMGFIGILIIIVLLLAIAGLVKYLFLGNHDRN
jgi:hypothetical protein